MHPRSTRAQERLPAGSEASVPKSERTTSREDPVSGRLRTEAKADAARYGSEISKRKCSMSSPNPLVAHFAGLDWAKQHHYVAGGRRDPTGCYSPHRTGPRLRSALERKRDPRSFALRTKGCDRAAERWREDYLIPGTEGLPAASSLPGHGVFGRSYRAA